MIALKSPVVGGTEARTETGAVAPGRRDGRIQGSRRRKGWIGTFLGRMERKGMGDG